MKVGMVLMDGYCFCVGALDVFFYIFSSFLDFSKNFLPPHEQKWLVMWERTGEA
jgi:hypothetical protein